MNAELIDTRQTSFAIDFLRPDEFIDNKAKIWLLDWEDLIMMRFLDWHAQVLWLCFASQFPNQWMVLLKLDWLA